MNTTGQSNSKPITKKILELHKQTRTFALVTQGVLTVPSIWRVLRFNLIAVTVEQPPIPEWNYLLHKFEDVTVCSFHVDPVSFQQITNFMNNVFLYVHRSELLNKIFELQETVDPMLQRHFILPSVATPISLPLLLVVTPPDSYDGANMAELDSSVFAYIDDTDSSTFNAVSEDASSVFGSIDESRDQSSQCPPVEESESSIYSTVEEPTSSVFPAVQESESSVFQQISEPSDSSAFTVTLSDIGSSQFSAVPDSDSSFYGFVPAPDPYIDSSSSHCDDVSEPFSTSSSIAGFVSEPGFSFDESSVVSSVSEPTDEQESSFIGTVSDPILTDSSSDVGSVSEPLPTLEEESSLIGTVSEPLLTLDESSSIAEDVSEPVATLEASRNVDDFSSSVVESVSEPTSDYYPSPRAPVPKKKEPAKKPAPNRKKRKSKLQQKQNSSSHESDSVNPDLIERDVHLSSSASSTGSKKKAVTKKPKITPKPKSIQVIIPPLNQPNLKPKQTSSISFKTLMPDSDGDNSFLYSISSSEFSLTHSTIEESDGPSTFDTFGSFSTGDSAYISEGEAAEAMKQWKQAESSSEIPILLHSNDGAQ